MGTENILMLVINHETHSSYSPTEYAHAPDYDLRRQIEHITVPFSLLDQVI